MLVSIVFILFLHLLDGPSSVLWFIPLCPLDNPYKRSTLYRYAHVLRFFLCMIYILFLYYHTEMGQLLTPILFAAHTIYHILRWVRGDWEDGEHMIFSCLKGAAYFVCLGYITQWPPTGNLLTYIVNCIILLHPVILSAVFECFGYYR